MKKILFSIVVLLLCGNCFAGDEFEHYERRGKKVNYYPELTVKDQVALQIFSSIIKRNYSNARRAGATRYVDEAYKWAETFLEKANNAMKER